MDQREQIAKAIFENRNPGKTWETDVGKGDYQAEWLKDADAVMAIMHAPQEQEHEQKEKPKAEKAVDYHPPGQQSSSKHIFGRKK